MQFRVLGPLSVTRAGQPVHLNHGNKTGLLLAILLAHTPHAVSIDELVAGLWGERPPRSARSNIHQYVHRLRHVVGPERIRSSPAGYALTVPEGELDAAQFRALSTRALTELDGGHQEKASQSLRTAIELWTGAAFAGFLDCDLIAGAARRLEHQRLSVYEQWSATQLELGRHRDVVDILSDLVEVNPYRETLREHLMVALHRSGRRADALELYRRTRVLLRAELGVEPSESLQRAHQGILRGEAGLAPRTEEPATRAATVNQLPPLFSPFVGREAERSALVKALSVKPATSAAVVAISGLGGLGKTSIAVWAANSVLGLFPDGCLFVDLRGTDNTPAVPHSVLGAFLRALGVAGPNVPRDRTERLGLYRSHTASRRLLVVLDNAYSEAQVRPLIPASPGCGVIVTSRHSLSALDQTHTLELDPLSPADSAELLRAGVPDRVLDDPVGVDDLVQSCGGLPLAIRILSGRLRSRDAPSPARLARVLRDAPHPIDELRLGDLSVRQSFMLSHRRLSPPAARLLGHLARLRQPHFTVQTCIPLMGARHRLAAAALSELMDANLVGGQQRTGAEAIRYQMHDLVRSFAVVEAESLGDHQFRAALKRLADAYFETLYATRSYLPAGPTKHLLGEIRADGPFHDEAGAVGWLDDEADNIVAALSSCTDAGLHHETWRLAFLLRPYLRLRHRTDERHAVAQLGLDSAKLAGNRQAEAHLLECLASAVLEDNPKDPRVGQRYHEALSMMREVGDDHGSAVCEEALGTYYQAIGDLDRAEAHHRRSLEVPAFADHPGNSIRSRVHIGTLYGRQHRYEEASQEFLTVLALAEESGDGYMACFAHHNLAYAYGLLARLDDARRHAELEIAKAVEIRNLLRQARGWDLLGELLADHDAAQSLAAYSRALDLYEQIGSDLADDLRARLLTAS